VRPTSSNSQQRRGAGLPDASRRDRGTPPRQRITPRQGAKTATRPRQPPQAAASEAQTISDSFPDSREPAARTGVLDMHIHRHVSALRASSAQRRPVPRACINAPRIMSPTRANPMKHATKTYDDSRERKSKHANAFQPHRAAQISGKANYVAKNVLPRQNSPRQMLFTLASSPSPMFVSGRC
jgi:hypothetical protein